MGCHKSGLRLNLRMRLSCSVWKRKMENKGYPNNNFTPGLENNSVTFAPGLENNNVTFAPGLEQDLTQTWSVDDLNQFQRTSTFQVMNDIVIDRGPSAYMSQLELFVEDRHLTTVQADGLVISTPTGSTAYSLAAGGSVVHPEVPSILLTPICAHSLSFRPMLLPDSVELKIQVPIDSRNTAWASFDGRHRMELQQGDFIMIELSRFPVPTICNVDQVNRETIETFLTLYRVLIGLLL